MQISWGYAEAYVDTSSGKFGLTIFESRSSWVGQGQILHKNIKRKYAKIFLKTICLAKLCNFSESNFSDNVH